MLMSLRALRLKLSLGLGDASPRVAVLSLGLRLFGDHLQVVNKFIFGFQLGNPTSDNVFISISTLLLMLFYGVRRHHAVVESSALHLPEDS